VWRAGGRRARRGGARRAAPVRRYPGDAGPACGPPWRCRGVAATRVARQPEVRPPRPRAPGHARTHPPPPRRVPVARRGRAAGGTRDQAPPGRGRAVGHRRRGARHRGAGLRVRLAARALARPGGAVALPVRAERRGGGAPAARPLRPVAPVGDGRARRGDALHARRPGRAHGRRHAAVLRGDRRRPGARHAARRPRAARPLGAVLRAGALRGLARAALRRARRAHRDRGAVPGGARLGRHARAARGHRPAAPRAPGPGRARARRVRRAAATRTRDDLGFLAESFNRTAETLGRSVGALRAEVAERERAEAALRDSETRLRARARRRRPPPRACAPWRRWRGG
jgi:hypothetical protein